MKSPGGVWWEVQHTGLASVSPGPGLEKQETHTPRNFEGSKERPLWNSGAKVIVCEMSALWPCLFEADLGPQDKSASARRLKEGVLGAARFF